VDENEVHFTWMRRTANMPELTEDNAAFVMHSIHYISPCLHLFIWIYPRHMGKPASTPPLTYYYY